MISPRSSLDVDHHVQSRNCTVHVRDDVAVHDEAAAQDCEVEKNGEYACFASLPISEGTGAINLEESLRKCLKVMPYRIRRL